MRETKMDEWQITQLFLSDTGVHEVYINLDNKKLKCNCEGFLERKNCKHARFVTLRMKENNGIYPVEISNRASRADSAFASLDPKMFRDFLLKYGKIEII